MAQAGDGHAGAVKMPAYSFLKKADSTVGIREGNVLTIYCIEEFVYDIINKPEVLTAIADVASAQAGTAVEVKLHKGGRRDRLREAPEPKPRRPSQSRWAPWPI